MRTVIKFIFKYFFALLLLQGRGETFAQVRYAFSQINATNGLANNEVRNITQLPDGRMMMVTNGIINIYNGTTFQYIHINEQYPYLLKGYLGYLRTYVENKERVWLKNQGKLMLINLISEHFENKADSVLAEMGVHEALADFFMDDSHNLWLLTNTDKLLFRDKVSGKVCAFFSNISKVNGRKDMLYDIAVSGNQIYLFYRSGAFLCYNIKTRQIISKGNTLSLADQQKYSGTLFPVQHGRDLYQLRTGPGGGVLLHYNNETGIWEKLLEKDYALNYLSVSKTGDLLVSCTQGLWFFDRKKNFEKQQIAQLQLVDGSSFNTEVSTLYFDDQDGLWIGTLNKGLLYYHPDRFKFRNFGRSFFPDNTTADLTVSCFAEKANGDMLVGTHNGLFDYMRGKDKLQLLPATGHVNCNAMVKGIGADIWLCTNNGLQKMGNGPLRHYPLGNISNVVFDPQRRMYLQTEHDGFGAFNPLTGKYVRYAAKEKSISKVNQMVYWKGLLIGMNNNGIFSYNIKKRSVYIPEREGDKVPPMFKHRNHNYKALFVDSRGWLWFGTQDGLYVWDDKRKKLTELTDNDGLINNSIKGIVEDAGHSLWISTSGGVSRLKISIEKNQPHFSFANFNSYDGIIKDEFVHRSIYLSKDNRLFVGGINGFNEIDLDRFSIRQRQLHPLFTGFRIFGQDVKENVSYSGNRILTRSISSTKSITLKHNQNFFTISFTGLNYVNPTQTYYRYKLDDLDADWHEVSTTDGIGRITYTDVAPGDYTFYVKATDNSGDWTGPVTRLNITVKAPFWKTPYAIAIYILIGTILIYSSLTFYLKQSKLAIIRRQKQKMDVMKMNFFSNMGHELRTPLTLILTPLETVLKKVDDLSVKSQLEIIRQNAANMLNTVNNLVDFKADDFHGETLNLSFVNAWDAVEPIVTPFAQACENKGIKFEKEIKETEMFLYLDVDKITKVLSNLLSNALKFTQPGGKIALKIYRDEESNLVMRVADNGIGIPQADLPKVFERYFQANNQIDGVKGSGIGLNLVKDYVDLHHGRISVSSEDHKGTDFIIHIPMDLKPAITDLQVPSGDKKHKVLIVEDNDVFRDFMATQLSAYYQVETAANGAAGLARIYHFLPDLVITDITMPEMDGIELCSKIKADVRVSHISVVLLTARYTDEVQLNAYASGADAYITKPFNLDILLLRVSKLLEQQEQRKKAFKSAIIVEPDKITTTSVDQEMLEKVIRLIEKNIQSSSYSVEQLSSDMNMDRTGLYRKLMAITGQAPTEFIRSIKLKKAALLLTEKRFSQQEIAQKVGFSTAAYFSKCFKDEYGVSPSQYKG
ncbi:ATP-binding protein [Mucilaginibacter auburnensis]|uniref:histidine kinase n=1 Tax=Mucilaginibacter auburnensis TaxID=1457233 RepID=A0A2H9VNS5_9SPHI|nr:ATP-binding protein [Mucilaginibacter auburnensis]PJJ79999.1 phospho-acceptor domain-containing protein [Mucilaginibacter auburnensis]